MNFLQEIHTSVICIGAFASVAHAATITLPTVTYDPTPNIYVNSNTVSFDLNISSIINGFIVGVDTLNSAVLSVFLRDDNVADTNEVYKIAIGSAQNFSGNDLSNGCFFVLCGAASVIEHITLNTASLLNLNTNGL